MHEDVPDKEYRQRREVLCSIKGEVGFKTSQTRGGNIVPVEVVKDVHKDHHWEQAEVDFADEKCFELEKFIGREVPEGDGGCFVVLAEDKGGKCVTRGGCRQGGGVRGGCAAGVSCVVGHC